MDEFQQKELLKKIEKDSAEIFERFGRKLAESQKDVDPDIQKIVDEHFWEML